jgi:hypothetical protein
MAIDARRRFVFDITTEDTSPALWYTNCSMLVYSKPLDFTELANLSLLVLQVSSASIRKEGLHPGLPVVCVRIRRGHGLGS